MPESLRPPVRLILPVQEIWGGSESAKDLITAKVEEAFSNTKKLELSDAYSVGFNFYRRVISAVSKEDAANYLYMLTTRGAIILEDIDVILGLVAPPEK